jgi:hypothetical protein
VCPSDYLKREYHAKLLHALRQTMLMFKRSHTETYISNAEAHNNGRIIHHTPAGFLIVEIRTEEFLKPEWHLWSELSVVSLFTYLIRDKLICNLHEILSVEKVSKCVFLSLSLWYTPQTAADWFLLNPKLTNFLCAVQALFRKATQYWIRTKMLEFVTILCQIWAEILSIN